MKPTTLRFFSEQNESQLGGTFTPLTLQHLEALDAGVTLGLIDRTPARAKVIRALNESQRPVGAWLLLPRPQGYFATHDNFADIEALIDDTLRWAEREQLRFEAIGLDFEPPFDELQAFMTSPLPTATKWSWRARDPSRWQTARAAYARIIAKLNDAGSRIETYQFPLVLADRHVRGSLWQRLAGGLDVSGAREVVMLYSSLLGVAGPGLIERLSSHCAAIGIGSTGGGIDPYPKLTWPQLERDLLLAAAHCSDLSIFSLEGCVQQAFLERLRDFDWQRSANATRSARAASHFISSVCAGLSAVTR